MLDNRLKMCAEMVSGTGIVCDVGTDHAYLAAELVKSGKCSRVIASDVKEGPLESAAKTVERYGLSDSIQLILSDGLENIPRTGVSDVVIAGMGGETISEILEKSWIFDRDDEVRLILQPMTKVEELRGWLGEFGFRILDERVAEDGERLYIVICAVYDGEGFEVSEFRNIRGFVSADDELGRRFLEKQADSLRRKADSLESGGMKELALHNRVMADNLLNDRDAVNSGRIFDYLDSLYPFSTQESWDNSGFLIEKYGLVNSVLLTLDIDKNAAYEAVESGADLVISHHPLIFEPLRSISAKSPVAVLMKNDIGAICLHTNLDIAKGGTNGVILRKLAEKLEFDGEPEPFEECSGGSLGFICRLAETIDADVMGNILMQIFNCEYIRMNRDGDLPINKIAVCSGSGGSLLSLAVEKHCDALITGDVKHDAWVAANNNWLTIYDCGHFHTENLVLEELRYQLELKFPQLEVNIAKCSVDPCVYIKR